MRERQPDCGRIGLPFFLQEKKVALEIENENGRKTVNITKRELDDIGLEFETYLMDRQNRCQNRCVFCFIDQLPKGLRESLYFKDDDARLSFLFGNYVTLTNLCKVDIDRIIRMRISPVNVSVHTMNPALRCRMMGNKFAGESLKWLHELADAGIKLNAQLVLCRELNDAQELIFSLNELAKLFPALQSVACVPVGLTRFRKGLAPLQPYDRESARKLVNIINKFGENFKKNYGTRLVYASDEFFIKAGLPFPNADDYEEFGQLENGVGMCTLFEQEFLTAMDEEVDIKMESARCVSVATGVDAAPFIKCLVDKAAKKWQNLECGVYAVHNRFFGQQITVAGLLTGGDLMEQLCGKPLGEELLIPDTMLRRAGDLFLDDVTLPQISCALGVKVTPVKVDGQMFLRQLLGWRE